MRNAPAGGDFHEFRVHGMDAKIRDFPAPEVDDRGLDQNPDLGMVIDRILEIERERARRVGIPLRREAPGFEVPSGYHGPRYGDPENPHQD